MGLLVRYLLDSHIFLWLDDLDRIPPSLREALSDQEHELYLSVASIWELTLKRAAGKLHFTGPFAAAADRYNIAVLPVGAEHAAETDQLPRFPKDPFDHMLLAQARVEGLVLVTHDKNLARYGVPVWLV